MDLEDGKAAQYHNPDEWTPECVICHTTLPEEQNLYLLECCEGCFIHQDCLSEVITQSGNTAKCPVCRQNINIRTEVEDILTDVNTQINSELMQLGVLKMIHGVVITSLYIYLIYMSSFVLEDNTLIVFLLTVASNFCGGGIQWFCIFLTPTYLNYGKNKNEYVFEKDMYWGVTITESGIIYRPIYNRFFTKNLPNTIQSWKHIINTNALIYCYPNPIMNIIIDHATIYFGWSGWIYFSILALFTTTYVMSCALFGDFCGLKAEVTTRRTRYVRVQDQDNPELRV